MFTHNVANPKSTRINLGQIITIANYKFQYLENTDDSAILVCLGLIGDPEILQETPDHFTMYWKSKEIDRNCAESCYGWLLYYSSDYVLYYSNFTRPVLQLLSSL